MGKFNGTKGVWKLEFNHKPKRTRLEVNAYPNPNRPELKENLYSYMLDEDQCSVSGCGCIIEEEANAKLIAAAPELLEAAIKLQEWNEKYPPNKVYDYGMAKQIERELTEIVNLQLEAIKKATE